MDTIIEFQNVKKSYGDKMILRGLDLQIETGSFVTMIGSSGCGKTTALKMVNGLLTPDAGEVLIHGENIRDKDQTQLRRHIGYVIQGSILFPHMTVEQNIAYVPNLINRKDKQKTRAAVDKWMEIVGLDKELRERSALAQKYWSWMLEQFSSMPPRRNCFSTRPQILSAN